MYPRLNNIRKKIAMSIELDVVKIFALCVLVIISLAFDRFVHVLLRFGWLPRLVIIETGG